MRYEISGLGATSDYDVVAGFNLFCARTMMQIMLESPERAIPSVATPAPATWTFCGRPTSWRS